MHVLWIHGRADFAGGAERYVAETASLLAERNGRNTLLYELGRHAVTEPRFTARFDGAFPLVDVERQIADLGPDVVYLHHITDSRTVEAIARTGVPAVRFFHDHALFCLREHKYTTIGHRTCTRTVGAGCYPCLGFVRPSPQRRGVRLRTVGELREAQREHQRLHAFVVGSRYMHHHVIAHGFEPARVHVNPLFVREPAHLPDVARDPDRLLFVGGLLRGKGLDVLIEALARLPCRVRLDVVGDGPQRALFEDLATRAGVRHRVHFAGPLAGQALEEAYRRAACLVMPSRSPETFGLTGPEALVRGTPVVASQVGGLDEWLEHGVTGLAVPSGEPDATAEAIQHMLDHPDAAQRMAEAGRQRCRERFTSERHVQALLDLFSALGKGAA